MALVVDELGARPAPVTLGRWSDVLSAAERAVRSYRAAASLEAVTYAWNAEGIALIALGRTGEALDVLGAARQQASELENSRGEGVCLYNLAWAYWVDGQHGRANGARLRCVTRCGLALVLAGPLLCT